jgi:hypothetical protein
MVGVVTTRHLLTHPFLITREFGGRCLLRCFWLTWTADHEVTFLECALPPSTRVALGVKNEELPCSVSSSSTNAKRSSS